MDPRAGRSSLTRALWDEAATEDQCLDDARRSESGVVPVKAPRLGSEPGLYAALTTAHWPFSKSNKLVDSAEDRRPARLRSSVASFHARFATHSVLNIRTATATCRYGTGVAPGTRIRQSLVGVWLGAGHSGFKSLLQKCQRRSQESRVAAKLVQRGPIALSRG